MNDTDLELTEEVLNSELTEENIELVLKYMKKNVTEYDLSDVTYEIDDDGSFIVKFDGYEMAFPKDITVNDSIYAINTAFNIENPTVSPTVPSSSGGSGQSRNYYNANNFNIAIDLDLYTSLIDKLSECKTEFEETFANNYETNGLTDELLSFYNNNIGESYLLKYDSIKSNTSSLSDNVQMSVMYYLSIDQSLASNMDSIIDSIFNGEMQMMQMMYDANGDTSLTYDEYLQLMNDSDEFFAAQRSQYLYQFMVQIDNYVAEYKLTEIPRMLDNVIEIFYYSKSNPTQSLEDFKNSLAQDYWNKVGYPSVEGDNSVLNKIPDDYWFGTEEKPTSDYDRFLYHVTFYDRVGDQDYVNLCEILRDNYSSDIPSYNLDWIFPNDIRPVPSGGDRNYSEFGRLRAINSELNDIYYEGVAIRNEIRDIVYDGATGEYDYSKLSLEKTRALCTRFQNVVNTDNYNNFFNSDMYVQGQQRAEDNFLAMINGTNFIEYNFPGVIPAFNADTQNSAVIKALCEHYNITDEQIISEIESSRSYDGDTVVLKNIIGKILREDGFDGMCSFITSYYNNLKQDPQVVSYLGEDVFKDKLTVDQVKRILLKGTNAQNTYCLTTWAWDQAGLITPFTERIANQYNSKMVQFRSTEETAKIYFMQKLDTSEVTDYYLEEARRIIKERHPEDKAMDYISDVQLKALALMLKKNYESGDNTWIKYVGDSSTSRGVLDELIVQGLAFDEAKDVVAVQTGGEYIWATLCGFGTGLYDGVGNFLGGVSDFFAADGLVSQAEYKQQFIKQLLTTDYSIFKNHNNPEVLAKLGSDYDEEYVNSLSIEGLTSQDVEDMIEYAKSNNIPRYELEHLLGLMKDEEYSKYNALVSAKNNGELDYYVNLANKSWLTGYTNVVYSVGQGVGNMIIPIVLNTLSAYCPMLSYISIGLTSLSTAGKTRESLMQQGITDQAVIWADAILHGLIEGAGEAIFGGVLNTKWGAKIFTKLQKIPVLGKALSFTDDIIGLVDKLPFASAMFKQFLKNDIKEILEELGENVWGYIVDGALGLGWPTGDQILAESWDTIWQTALTTPILNAFSGTMNKHLRKKITVAGLVVEVSLADIQAFTNENGSINASGLLSYLANDGRLSGKLPQAASRLNSLLRSDVVNDVEIREDADGHKKYVVTLANNNVLEYDLNNFDADSNNLFSDIAQQFPHLLVAALNNENSTTTFIQKMFAIYDNKMIPYMVQGLDSKQMLSLVESLDLDTATRVVSSMRPQQATAELFVEYAKKLDLELSDDLIAKYKGIVENHNNGLDPGSQWKRIDSFGDNMSLISLMMDLISGKNGDVNYDMGQIFGRVPDGVPSQEYYERMASKVIEILSKASPKQASELINNPTRMQDLMDNLEDIWTNTPTTGDKATDIQAKKDAVLAFLNKTFKTDLRSAYEQAVYYEFLYSLEMTYELSQDGAYDIPYQEVLLRRYLAKRDAIQEEPKQVKSNNGTHYTDVLPKVDPYISDKRLVTYMEEMAGKDGIFMVKYYAEQHGFDYASDPIACWGEYMADENNPPIMVHGITFQSASKYGNNYVAFGGNIGRGNDNAGTNYQDNGGYMMRIIDYDTLARDYPDLCEVRTINGEKQLYIKDYERFGNEVVGGVVVTNGMYIIETTIPMSEVYLTMNNEGAFTNYGAPGGYLHRSYGIETTVHQQKVGGTAAMTLQPGQVVTIPLGGNKSVRISRR